MKDNDSAFIKEVADLYYSTFDDEHPQGNMSAVAEHFGITRAKVNKILITAGVIDSPLHQDIMKLKDRGYDTDDIASALGVSAATVKINIPYEKVIYNGTEKSTGAGYVEEYRKREKVFLDKVVRKPSDLEIEREAWLNSEEYQEYRKQLKESDMDPKYEDDSVHMMPVFTREESKLFKIRPDVMLLHIELKADLSDVKDLAKLKYGNTISRDILVPDSLPLHNLHYAINQAFGFTNSHLHRYNFTEDDFNWVTDHKVSIWKKLIGLVFKNPIREENIDFWDDDYDGGSPKKWMRSKYTGPVYNKVFKESFPYIKCEMMNCKVRSRTLENLIREFEYDPFEVNETLSIFEAVSDVGREEFSDVKEYYDCIKACVKDAARYVDRDMRSQPFVYSFASSLTYFYDFGDNWKFTITPEGSAEYLIEQGRLTKDQFREAIRDVCTIARPVVVAADGLPLVEDVGGIYGYKDFLRGINGQASEMYSDKKESLIWAKSQEWTGKIGNLKNIL